VKFGVVVFWDKRIVSAGAESLRFRAICTEEFLPIYTVPWVTRPHLKSIIHTQTRTV